MIKILLLVLLSACSGSQKEIVKVDQIIFGRYCGECGGNCAPMYRYSTQNNTSVLFADTNNHYFRSEASLCTIPVKDERKILRARELANHIPEKLLHYGAYDEEYVSGNLTVEINAVYTLN